MNIFKWVKKRFDLHRFDRRIKKWKNVKSDKLKSVAPTIIEHYKRLRKMREEMS